MPTIQGVKIEPRFEGGPQLWKVTVLWDVDQTITAYGETLSIALLKLSNLVKQQEYKDVQTEALKRGE